MSANTIRLRQLAWYDNDELEIRFPDSWEITTCYMKGHDRPPLSDQSFREAFANPIDTRPIKELARGKKEVVILFDDMARPTRFAQIIPYVLEELEAAGRPAPIKDTTTQARATGTLTSGAGGLY